MSEGLGVSAPCNSKPLIGKRYKMIVQGGVKLKEPSRMHLVECLVGCIHMQVPGMSAFG